MFKNFRYNFLRYSIFILAVGVIGGTVMAGIGRILGISLFNDYSGIPGYIGIAVLVGTASVIERRISAWLENDSNPHSD